jgi:hypothetical protein
MSVTFSESKRDRIYFIVALRSPRRVHLKLNQTLTGSHVVFFNRMP